MAGAQCRNPWASDMVRAHQPRDRYLMMTLHKTDSLAHFKENTEEIIDLLKSAASHWS